MYLTKCRDGKCHDRKCHEGNCSKCGGSAWMYIGDQKVCAICGDIEESKWFPKGHIEGD